MKLGYEPSSHNHRPRRPSSSSFFRSSSSLSLFFLSLFSSSLARKVFSRFEKWRDIKREEKSSGRNVRGAMWRSAVYEPLSSPWNDTKRQFAADPARTDPNKNGGARAGCGGSSLKMHARSAGFPGRWPGRVSGLYVGRQSVGHAVGPNHLSASSSFVEVRHVWPCTIFATTFPGKKGKIGRIEYFHIFSRIVPVHRRYRTIYHSYSFKLFPFLSPIFENESFETKVCNWLIILIIIDNRQIMARIREKKCT